MSDHSQLPPRFRAPSALTWVVVVGFAAFFIQGVIASDISFDRLMRGANNLVRFVGQAVPPDFTRMPNIAYAMLETMNIAIVGVTFGCLF